jgi:hypothetical protein
VLSGLPRPGWSVLPGPLWSDLLWSGPLWSDLLWSDWSVRPDWSAGVAAEPPPVAGTCMSNTSAGLRSC